ncbi:MAG: hypothetical protein R3F44_04725 [Candidatus Competibacteraceae bacterium]
MCEQALRQEFDFGPLHGGDLGEGARFVELGLQNRIAAPVA